MNRGGDIFLWSASGERDGDYPHHEGHIENHTVLPINGVSSAHCNMWNRYLVESIQCIGTYTSSELLSQALSSPLPNCDPPSLAMVKHSEGEALGFTVLLAGGST